MTMTFTKDVTPANYDDAMYRLWAALAASGSWDDVGGGDGLSAYSGSASVVSGSGSGANGIGNSKAWIHLRKASGGAGPYADRGELIIQRHTASSAFWRIKYSRAAGFSGGSPGANQTPSATDEQFICGGGSDASPSFEQIFSGTPGAQYQQIGIGDVDEHFAFFMFTYPSGGGALTGALICDAGQSGSFSPSEIDPYVFFAGLAFGLTNLVDETAGSFAGVFKGWLGAGTGGEGWTTIPMAFYCAFAGGVFNVVAPASSGTYALGVDPFDGKDVLLPVAYARRAGIAGPNGYKMQSQLAAGCGTVKVVGDAVSVNATADRMNLPNGLAYPWSVAEPAV